MPILAKRFYRIAYVERAVFCGSQLLCQNSRPPDETTYSTLNGILLSAGCSPSLGMSVVDMLSPVIMAIESSLDRRFATVLKTDVCLPQMRRGGSGKLTDLRATASPNPLSSDCPVHHR